LRTPTPAKPTREEGRNVSGLINRFNRLAARLARTKVQSCVSTGPILSVSFDDFPKSAWTCGGQILSAHKAAATYYTAGRFCGKTRDDIVYFDRADLAAVVAAGHELGCHTYSHKHAPQISSAELRDDCARNREFVNDCLPGVGLTNFAYPYGDVSARVKGLVARQYATARGIRPGVNISPLDLALLKALPLEIRSWTEARMEALAAEAAQTNGWLILFTHDVDDEPSPFGCTPRMLDLALEIGRRHGLEILSVGSAARRLLASVGPETELAARAA
jgi:peptidoglycan/xylan/chitin deacetylase (PgdA/CDA1 family)